jgi:hypothetical protein
MTEYYAFLRKIIVARRNYEGKYPGRHCMNKFEFRHCVQVEFYGLGFFAGSLKREVT